MEEEEKTDAQCTSGRKNRESKWLAPLVEGAPLTTTHVQVRSSSPRGVRKASRTPHQGGEVLELPQLTRGQSGGQNLRPAGCVPLGHWLGREAGDCRRWEDGTGRGRGTTYGETRDTPLFKERMEKAEHKETSSHRLCGHLCNSPLSSGPRFQGSPCPGRPQRGLTWNLWPWPNVLPFTARN